VPLATHRSRGKTKAGGKRRNPGTGDGHQRVQRSKKGGGRGSGGIGKLAGLTELTAGGPKKTGGTEAGRSLKNVRTEKKKVGSPGNKGKRIKPALTCRDNITNGEMREGESDAKGKRRRAIFG